MSDLLRQVVETTANDHETYLAIESESRGVERAMKHALDIVFGEGWSYSAACESIDKLERLHAKSQALAVECDKARIAALRAHAAAANKLGRYAKENEE